MAEGARLESVFRGNSNVGSNPTLSAKLMLKKNLLPVPGSPFPCYLMGQWLQNGEIQAIHRKYVPMSQQ